MTIKQFPFWQLNNFIRLVVSTPRIIKREKITTILL